MPSRRAGGEPGRSILFVIADAAVTLERLLAIHATDLRSALAEAANLVMEATGAEKIDIFLYDAPHKTLVALGASNTRLGRLQKELGLDHRPVSNGGSTVRSFESGSPVLVKNAAEDASEVPGLARAMGVRSTVCVPFEYGGHRRGVLEMNSTTPGHYGEDDVSFLAAVARWVGSVAERAALVEQIRAAAVEQGRRAAADEIMSVFAHDMRNRLNPVVSWVTLLAKRAQREQHEGFLRDATAAVRATRKLASFLEKLLDSARLDQGLFTLNVEPFELCALVKETADSFAAPGHALVHVVSCEDIMVTADRVRLQQAIENVLANAIRHSPKGAFVHVDLRSEEADDRERRAILVVRDEGAGVPEHLMPTLFERFVHGTGSKGLGLGLYLAKRTLVAHGGELTVQSPPGRGAEFTFVLPLTRYMPTSDHPPSKTDGMP